MLVAREGVGRRHRGDAGAYLPGRHLYRGRPRLLAPAARRQRPRSERGYPGRSIRSVPEGFEALLGVPISRSDDSLDGVLIVYSRSRRAWRTKETEALVSLAANTAAALANAALYLRVSLEREQSIAILSSVADGIVAVDRSGGIVLWNAAAERITGVASGDALGLTPAEVLRQELDSGAEQGERSISIKRGGRELWLEVTEATMRDPSRPDRRQDLHAQGRLHRSLRRAGQVRLRLLGLARAARAAHLDLRLRRDPPSPRRAVRRAAAADVPLLHRLGVRAPDRDRRRAARRRRARFRRPAGGAGADRRGKRRARGCRGRSPGRRQRQRPRVRDRSRRRVRSAPRPTATSCAGCSST